MSRGPLEAGSGPRRQPYASTARGRLLVSEWLSCPVEHVREIRSQLLMKLALLDRRGQDGAELVRRQRETLAPIVRAFESQRPEDDGTGFDATLRAWRRQRVGRARFPRRACVQAYSTGSSAPHSWSVNSRDRIRNR